MGPQIHINVRTHTLRYSIIPIWLGLIGHNVISLLADDASMSPSALEDAEEASALADLPAEEALTKLQNQNRLLRTKLRAAFKAEEENTELRDQVEKLAKQLVSLTGLMLQPHMGRSRQINSFCGTFSRVQKLYTEGTTFTEGYSP